MEQLNIPMLVASILLAVLIGVFYILGIFIRGRALNAVSYIGVLLNALFIVALLFVGVKLEVATLCVMCSVLSYTFCYYVRYELDKRGKADDTTDSEPSAPSVKDGEVEV